jgi:hypothetical protein
MQNSDTTPLEDRKIVELLIASGPLTAPKICKHFGVKNHQNAVYRLERLAEKGIVNVAKKKYGTTYGVNDKKISTPTSVTLQALLTLIFLAMGVSMWLFNYIQAAAGYLFISSIIGTSVVFVSALKYKKEKIKNLLALLD